MSRNEDYLDNLLTSVTDTLSQFDDDFEQNRESLKQSYQTQNNLPPKTQSALDEVREDNFLKEFEEDLQNDGSDDDFMRDFERELRGEMGSGTDQPENNEDKYESIPFETDNTDMDADLDDILSDFSDMPDADADTTVAFDDDVFAQLNDAQAQQEPITAPDGLEGLEDIFSDMPDEMSTEMDFPQTETDAGMVTQAQPSETLQLEDVPAGVQLDDMMAEDPMTISQTAEEPLLDSQVPDEFVSEQPQDDLGLSLDDILNESDDVLSQLENYANDEDSTMDAGSLSAEETASLIEDGVGSAGDSIGLSDSQEATKAMNEDPFSIGPDFAYDETAGVPPEPEKGKKKKREKNPNSIFAKLSRVLFGSPEELNPELAAEIAAERAKRGEDDPENMDPAALKAKKKQEKELKKQQKKEAADLKKQEKEASKAEKAAKKASKPKKEKKPKKKKELPKEPPLPRVPVTMMWILALSIMVLVFLGSSVLGYFSSVNQSKDAFDKGDYVTAYEKLQGVKIKKADEELYHASAALAGVQMELDAYTALMEQKQYEMALDALIRGIGRCQIHEKDAEEWNMAEQLSAMEKQLGNLLSDQFNVSKRTARKLYKIQKRSDYTLQLHEIMSKLGLYEAVSA